MFGTFGLGLGGEESVGDVRDGGFREWEMSFKVESLAMEVASLVQERRVMREQLEGAHEGLRSLTSAVEILAREMRYLREPGGRDDNGEEGRRRRRRDPPNGYSAVGGLGGFDPWNGAFGTAISTSAAASAGSTMRVLADLERAKRVVSAHELLKRELEAIAPSQPEMSFTSRDAFLALDSEEAFSKDELIAKESLPETHTLEHSIWDACLFLGVGVLGGFDALLLFVSWLINFVVQFLFTFIIWSRFHQSPYNQELVESLRKWRAIYGHDSTFMNPTTQQSLVHSVCSGSDVMTTSQTQMELYKTMREFLPTFRPDSLSNFIRTNLSLPAYDDKTSQRDGGVPFDQFFFSGTHLCTMLMMLWTLMICREIRATYETHSAVWAKARLLPEDSIIVRIPSTGHLVLRSITVRRAIFVTVFVTLPRLCIACLLLVGGSYFIIAAENMEDLILNALSLEFIIHTDELLYSVVAPKSIRMVVEEVRPVNVGVFFNRFRRYFKVLMLIAIISYVAIVNLLVLDPVVQAMQDAMTTMCGGDVEFVTTRYSDGIMRAVDPDEGSLDSVETNYAYCSVLQRTGLAGASAGGWLKRTPLIQESETFKCAGLTDNKKLVKEAFGTSELRRKGMMSLQELPEYKTAPCEDTNISGNVRIKMMLQEATGNHFLSQCSEAWALCGEPVSTGFGSTLARLYCPGTCRCANAGQFFTGSGEGCPRSCSVEWQKKIVDAPNCQDFTPQQLGQDEMWSSYIFSVVSYLQQMATPFSVGLGREINRTALSFGCTAMAKHYVDESSASGKYVDFCDPVKMRGAFAGAEHRTVRYFCPQTCQCAEECARDQSCADCPRSCGAGPLAIPSVLGR